MDIAQQLRLIQDRYAKVDEAMRQENGGRLHHDTAHGIWGPSHLLDCYELFLRISLDEKKGFLDLGSGDGRIALLAAVFTKSLGIEADPRLHAIAVRVRNELLPTLPALARCELRCADYTAPDASHDLSSFDTLFTFQDHRWDPAFEQRLMHECNGTLYSYNRIFLPERIPKGKTIWIEQLPVVTYPLGERMLDEK
jgi:SAM-dependent methyltransferase